jgi:hypothetical protein
VEVEGWTRKGTSRGKGKTGDHYRYTLTLSNGEILYTRVSHGSGQLDDPKLIAHVLRDELAVSEKDFWACAEKGKLPPRPRTPAPPASGEALDAKLVRNLIRKVGLSEAEIATLTKQDAITRWNEYLARGGP